MLLAPLFSCQEHITSVIVTTSVKALHIELDLNMGGENKHFLHKAVGPSIGLPSEFMESSLACFQPGN